MSTRALFRSQEFTIDFIAVIFLIVAVIELFYRWTFQTPELFWSSILTDLLFLNVTHNAFTLALFISIPEVRTWIHKRTDGRPLRFWLPFAALLIVVFLFFLIVMKLLDGWLALFALILLVDFIPIHHALAQSKGLSLNRRRELGIHVSGSDQATHAAFWLLMFSVVGMVASLRFNRPDVIAPETLQDAKIVCLCLAISALIYIFARAPRAFFLRLLLWPLSGFSFVAAMGTRAIHGIEYLGVFNRFVQSSSASTDEKRRAWKIVALLSVVVVLAGYFRISRHHGFMRGWIIGGIASLSLAMSFAHYYADRILFRMRDDLTRQHIGPLLKRSKR